MAELGYAAAWPAVPPPQQAVAAWLVAHHERAGLAGYWQAASTTVTSGGRVLVAAITLGPAPATPVAPRRRPSARPAHAGQADRWESSAAWYQPARHDATFVIAVDRPGRAGRPVGRGGPRPLRPPAAQYQVGQDVIMLYRYNLLTRLRGPRSPARADPGAVAGLASSCAAALAREEEELLAEQPPQRRRAEVGAGQRG